MKVENPKELEKLIGILRKTGVESLKLGEFEIKLRPDAPLSKYKKKQDDGKELAEMTPEEKMAYEEQLLFWSSTPPGIVNGKDNA